VVLINLVFGQTQTPSDTQLGVIDELVKQHKQAIQEMREKYGITKTEGCKYTMDELKKIAERHGMYQLAGERFFIKLPGTDGFEYYQTFYNQCKIVVYDISGTLSPPSAPSLTPLGQGILAKQDIKFGVDVNLFKVLFQLLMYGAGIFWVVRVARKVVEGDFSEAAVSFFQGFIIVATMYVLYRMM
jgi:hypothetical protein